MSTKFLVAVGVEIALLGILVLLIFTRQLEGKWETWLVAFVGIPVQYGIFNVIASGQATTTTTTTSSPPSTTTETKGPA